MVNYAALLPIFAGLLGVANAHSRVYGLWVNDVDQGDGRSTYIRSPPNNSPVKDVSSTDIICNAANVAAPSSVSVSAGDKITFEWYHDNRADDIIDKSHKGPVTVYIADAATNGAGAVWTKLSEEGYSGGVWAVENLIKNAGKHSLTLPSSLAAGDYLLRAEIIAHHESDTDYTVNNARGAQFYPSCAQIKVKTGGPTKPPGTYGFVGGYSPTDPGILFNLYGSFTSYAIPGPAVWTGAGGAVATSAAATTTTTTTKAAVTATTTTKAAAITTTITKAAATTTANATTVTVTRTVIAPGIVTSSAAATPIISTTLATLTRKLATLTRKPTTTPPPAASSVPKTSESTNKCLDEINACIRQAQSSIGGAPNFSACEAGRAACY